MNIGSDNISNRFVVPAELKDALDYYLKGGHHDFCDLAPSMWEVTDEKCTCGYDNVIKILRGLI